MTCPLRSLALAAALATPVFAATAASAGPVNWERYMQTGSSAAAVASGIAQVTPCKVPLSFDETTEGDQVTLSISCNTGDDNESGVVLFFNNYGGTLVLDRFQIAG